MGSGCRVGATGEVAGSGIGSWNVDRTVRPGAVLYVGPMGTQFTEISDKHREFIEAQQVYFVATAARDGRVNVSPKGLDSLRVVSANRIVWLNGTGSGNESAAHILDNPRMTVMFCAFEGKPSILRLYGSARAVYTGEPEWQELADLFPPLPGARNVFILDVDLVQNSCGFGVPLFEAVGQRDLMPTWANARGEDGLNEYWQKKNRVSIDGFPTGLPE